SLLLCQPANERMGLLPVTSLAVCINEGRSEMSEPALSAAVDRAAGSANAPQSRHLAFKPCGRLLGCHGRSRRLQQLDCEAIDAFAVVPEICPVIGRPCLKPRDLGLQCLDL